MSAKKPICQKCESYFVTWEKDRPHGCKAHNFKSKEIPSSVVVQSSGMNCLLFKEKEKKNTAGK